MGSWAGGAQSFRQLPCKPQAAQGSLVPLLGVLVIHTVSPISTDIGPSLGGMIISEIRSSTDGALGSLQSLLQGSSPIPGGPAGPRRGFRGMLGQMHAWEAPAGLGKAPREWGPSGHSSPSLGQMVELQGGCPYIAFLDGFPRLSWVRTSPRLAGRMRPQAPAVSPGMEMLVAAFGSIASTRSRLEELQSNYSQRLASLRDGLNQTLQRCGRPCDSVSLDGLAFSANFSMVRRGRVWGKEPPAAPSLAPRSPLTPGSSPQIPGVEQQLEALRDVSGSNIEADLEEVRGPPHTQAQGWVLLVLLGLCCEGVGWEEPCQELIAVT